MPNASLKNQVTLHMIRDIVNQYLSHPRHHNAGMEKLLFMGLNWLVYAVQVYERNKLIEAVQEQMDATENPLTILHLRNVVNAIQAQEYIIEVQGEPPK